MKITSYFIALLVFLSTNVFAVTIINENSKSIKYWINDGTACSLEYTKGELSSGGNLLWTGTVLYHPTKICVHARGWTSTTGTYAYNVNNDNCILTVKDAGFFRGIKIEKGTGC